MPDASATRLHSMLLHVVAEQPILFAQVKLAAGNNRMRPARRSAAVRDFELALHLVLGRRSLDQGHHTIVVAEIEVAIRIDHGRRSAAGPATLVPDHLAGLELDTDRLTVVV